MPVIAVTKDNFEQEVLKCDKSVLVDFWAEWCGPCKRMSAVVEEIADEHSDKKICKINVDEQPELAQRFNIMSIPTLIVFKDGTSITRVAGVRNKQDVLSLFNS